MRMLDFVLLNKTMDKIPVVIVVVGIMVVIVLMTVLYLWKLEICPGHQTAVTTRVNARSTVTIVTNSNSKCSEILVTINVITTTGRIKVNKTILHLLIPVDTAEAIIGTMIVTRSSTINLLDNLTT
jgi:hypothetical protein